MLRAGHLNSSMDAVHGTSCREGVPSKEAAKKISSERNLQARMHNDLWESVNGVQLRSGQRHYDVVVNQGPGFFSRACLLCVTAFSSLQRIRSACAQTSW